MDGVNWFRCECAPGFAGPDCRISEYLKEERMGTYRKRGVGGLPSIPWPLTSSGVKG